MLTRSWMRKRTKLAGIKDMAKITQMDTTTSVEVVALKTNTEERGNKKREGESERKRRREGEKERG